MATGHTSCTPHATATPTTHAHTLFPLPLSLRLQRTDPAPFYLLDEIDAALDLTYRAAVAALIKKQAYDAESPAQ